MNIEEWNATNAGGMTLKVISTRAFTTGQRVEYTLTEKGSKKEVAYTTIVYGKTELERSASLLCKVQAIHDVKHPPTIKEVPKKKRRSFADLSGSDKL